MHLKTDIEKKIENSVLSIAWLAWYPVRKGSSALWIGPERAAVLSWLRSRCGNVVVTDPENEEEERFDYVISFDGLEYQKDPVSALQRWLSFLKPEGILLLGADNRYGLKYLLGAGEKHTGIPYYGVNGYFSGIAGKENALPDPQTGGRSYSKNEWAGILINAGVKQYRFFYPVPDARMPQLIFTDEWKDGSDTARLFDYNYADPSLRALEHRIFREAAENGALSFVSDSFLIEITKEGTLSGIDYAVITADRGENGSMATVIGPGSRVRKRALWKAGERKLKETKTLAVELNALGIPVLDPELKEDGCGRYLEMPLAKGELLSHAMERLIVCDTEKFLALFDSVYDCIKKSFTADSDGKTPLTGSADGSGRVFLDLAPCNAFYREEDGSILFFDQEFAGDGLTPAFSLYRTIKYFFMSPKRNEWPLSAEDLYERYGITKEMAADFEEQERIFIQKVRNADDFSWALELSVPDTGRMVADAEKAAKEQKKPYRVGYVPGVFDLFHVGHLRLIERCKERCEYLIVGVLTDELVDFYKAKRPVIPFEERKRIIEALKCVDRVVAVNFENTDKIAAWEQLKYDCHFSGDDHTGDWDHIREELRKRGAEMEFFSYTQGVSTTEIIEEIRMK